MFAFRNYESLYRQKMSKIEVEISVFDNNT